MQREAILLLFALISAWQDIRHRSVPALLFFIFALAALITGFSAGKLPALFSGTLPGIALLLLSRLTHGAIGEGDAWFFIVSGLYLPLAQNFLLLVTAVLLGGVYSLFLFVIHRIKDGRYAGKESFPFLPFAAAALLIALAAGF